LVAGNYNEANYNSANYRTSLAADGYNYQDENFDNVAFRTGGRTRSVLAEESGLGTDVADYYRLVEFTDSGVGTETTCWVLWGNFCEINFCFENYWAHGGTEASAIGCYSFWNYCTENFMTDGAFISVTDSAIGTEAILSPITVLVTDYVVGVDVPYRVENEISIDGTALPGVETITISEKTVIKSSPIDDSLPVRQQVGKLGRTLDIVGWADTLDELQTIKDLADGEDHRLMLPTGDGFTVHIPETDPLRNPETDALGRYRYSLLVIERVDVV